MVENPDCLEMKEDGPFIHCTRFRQDSDNDVAVANQAPVEKKSSDAVTTMIAAKSTLIFATAFLMSI